MYDNEREFYYSPIGGSPVGENDSTGSTSASDAAKNADIQDSAMTQSAQVTQTAQTTQPAQTIQSMQVTQTAQATQSTQVTQPAQTTQSMRETQSTQTTQGYTGYTGYTGYSGYSSTQNNTQTTASRSYNDSRRSVGTVSEQTGTRRETRTGKQKKGSFFRKALISLSLGLLFGIFAGVGFLGVTQATHALQKSLPVVTDNEAVLESSETEKKETDTETLVQKTEPEVIYATSSGSVAQIVKDVMPAMVSITNNYTEVTTFWGQTYSEELSASGSGIIVAQNDEELLIVTNQHVVADADFLKVTLDDGTEVEAKIKGTDKDMDLAVIAISVDDLSAETLRAISVASLGNSDLLELGEQVIAIGNALGYGQSVTVGYISALDREIEVEDGSVRSFIQTDAAINPGNSGGALLNSAGQVIGINSNKIGGSSIEGMGYAIPITAASPIIADLMERQTRNKVADGATGYMGISYQDVTEQIAQMYGMPKGVYVVSVQEGSGAEAAGIMKGDVITKFDGDSIESFEDLQEVLQYFAPGDTVKVVVQRPMKGEYVEMTLELTLGERPTNR